MEVAGYSAISRKSLNDGDATICFAILCFRKTSCSCRSRCIAVELARNASVFWFNYVVLLDVFRHIVANTSTTSTIPTGHNSNSKSRQKWWRYFVNGGCTISTIKQVSPLKNLKNRVQTRKSEGSGDGGDILGISSKRWTQVFCENGEDVVRIREYIFHLIVCIEKAKT
jgi:hypothetical protein